MRGTRGALWALGLAGAAYVWKNKDKLQRQANNFGSQATSPNQLPDYRSDTSNQYSDYDAANEGQSEPVNVKRGTPWGGSDV